MRPILIYFFCLTAPLLFAKTNSKSKMITHTIRLRPHQDLKLSLDSFIKEHKIDAACIITCVGSTETTVLRYANQKEATTIVAKQEIVSLVGTLSAISGSHLHMSIADSNGVVKGGHLKEGTLIYTTAEIVIGELTKVRFNRTIDNTYGYKELSVENK